MENSIKTTTPLATETQVKEKTKDYNILVCIRVRPVVKSEYGKEVAIVCDEDNKSICIDTRANIIRSSLDRVFNDKTNQYEVFDYLKDYIPAVIQGYNCTVFAYGQTGSGKTHTMFGSDWENVLNKTGIRTTLQNTYVENIEEDRVYSGVIPRMIYTLFNDLEKEENKASNFTVYCSFLQIYNERIYDLLSDKYGTKPLDIREDKINGIYVEGLMEYCVSNQNECLMLMQKGERNRYIRSTSSNIKIVESTKADSKGRLQRAKLNLCDLAGSEKIKKSGDVKGSHLDELKNINLSLTTLGKVIHTLSQNSKKAVVAYRESKLTRLLQDSLGGNTRTCLIATLSPLLENVDESVSTLKFAERAQHIVTHVHSNKVSAVDQELVAKLQKEIKYLRDILNIRRQGGGLSDVHNRLLILQEENERLRKAHISIQEVETLIEENKKMKLELQKLRAATAFTSEIDGGLINDSEIPSALPNFNQIDSGTPNRSYFHEPTHPDESSPLSKPASSIKFPQINTRSKKGSVDSMGLDRLVLPSRKVSHNDYYSTQRTPETSMRSGQYSELRRIGRAALMTPLTDIQSSEINLPVRVRGRTYESKQSPSKSPSVMVKQETRKREHNRAIERLRELDSLQKKQQEKLKGYNIDERSYTASQSTASNTNENSTSKYNERFNPYKIRKEIEEKYNNKYKEKTHAELNKRNDEYLKNRLKYLEKSLFK